jgi:ArsR family transcriptional regulator
MQGEGDYRWCAERLKALADPGRLQIVNCLLHGGRNVSELARELGLPAVKVSHHLRVLRNTRVVRPEKDGKFIVYSLHPEIVRAGGPALEKTLDFGCCRVVLFQPNAGD